jgi:hypothetical protein
VSATTDVTTPATTAPRPEPRWPVVVAVIAAVALQVALPGRFAPGHRAVPLLELVLLVALVVADPGRIDRGSAWLRRAGVVLVLMITVSNVWSAVRLVLAIVAGADDDPVALLSSGAAIWATNVVVFGLWFWEVDGGGPYERVHAPRRHPSFAFPQTQDPALAPPGWSARFVDYLYLSFTNATAFSPTDVMPLARWAKLTMMGQAAVSLAITALVVARAIGLFK